MVRLGMHSSLWTARWTPTAVETLVPKAALHGLAVIEIALLAPEIARALSVWRPVADSAEQVLRDGVPFLRDLARRHGLLAS